MDLMEQMHDGVDSLNVPIEEICEINQLELAADIKKRLKQMIRNLSLIPQIAGSISVPSLT